MDRRGGWRPKQNRTEGMWMYGLLFQRVSKYVSESCATVLCLCRNERVVQRVQGGEDETRQMVMDEMARVPEVRTQRLYTQELSRNWKTGNGEGEPASRNWVSAQARQASQPSCRSAGTIQLCHSLPLFCPPSPEQGCRRGRRGRRDGQSRQESQRGKQVKLGQQRTDGEGVRSRVRGVRRAWEAANENECEKSQGLEYGVP
ncbi:hypothetical protein BKA56DRAFT_298437 [Ilyonectria sp. MPI-CAGE-AT-0026]|nr:hypothetical protein BKA56DRAFT_298437 [Ilyonectria sp. MPI-CAGE-AT-0026]